MAYIDHTMPNVRRVWGRAFRRQSVGIKAYTDPRPQITGTAVACNESDVVTGSKTVLISLIAGQQFVASGTLFNAQRQAILNGLTARESEAHGWNVEVRDKAAVTTVVRTSATRVTVTLPASASYATTADEHVDITLPRAAVAYHRDKQVHWPSSVPLVITSGA